MAIEALSKMPSYSEELDLNLTKPEDRFKWFLASVLFAKRISTEISKKTFRRFETEGIVTPEAIIEAGWDRLVEVLDSGGYVRYDFSTATKLLEIAKVLKERYSSLENLHNQAKDSRELERMLLEFKGIGPATVNIFLRELRHIWKKANPQPSDIAKQAAKKLGLKQADTVNMESSLVRLSLEFCKRRRCPSCPVRDSCQTAK